MKLAEEKAKQEEIEKQKKITKKLVAEAKAKKAETLVAPASKKRIYVKADNSAGVPAGYYELDETATKQYQAAKRREAAAKK